MTFPLGVLIFRHPRRHQRQAFKQREVRQLDFSARASSNCSAAGVIKLQSSELIDADPEAAEHLQRRPAADHRHPQGRGTLQLLHGARGQKLRDKLDGVTAALETVSVSRPGGLALLLSATVASVAIWLLVFAFYAVLSRGAGLPEDLSFVEAAFGSSLAVLFNLLPINGFAGFGTQEAGWQVGFSLVGVAPELALSSGVAAHLVQLFNVVLMGILGHLGLGLLGQKRPS